MKKENSQIPLTVKLPFAKKSFGQNFLVDENYIEKILAALNPQIDDTIIEIGPGRGAITEKLVRKSGKSYCY
jgi:16S rRNA A1518/A1519 N6-dimethyltransferase RsmA/KsgA/DIM1 with predicted DNA glycosylase/AP lyase activity